MTLRLPQCNLRSTEHVHAHHSSSSTRIACKNGRRLYIAAAEGPQKMSWMNSSKSKAGKLSTQGAPPAQGSPSSQEMDSTKAGDNNVPLLARLYEASLNRLFNQGTYEPEIGEAMRNGR